MVIVILRSATNKITKKNTERNKGIKIVQQTIFNKEEGSNGRREETRYIENKW